MSKLIVYFEDEDDIYVLDENGNPINSEFKIVKLNWEMDRCPICDTDIYDPDETVCQVCKINWDKAFDMEDNLKVAKLIHKRL